jgi:hypothetical protein
LAPDNRYASFMMRFQWMKNDQQPTWIVSMQSTKTGGLRWFASLEALITFLREEFGEYDGADVASLSGTRVPESETHQIPGSR